MEPIKILKNVVNRPTQGSPQYFIVLNRMPVFVYERKGDLLLAEDSGFYSCYRYEAPSKGFQAFGGSKFDIQLKNGEVEKAHGQWWSTRHPESQNKKMCDRGYQTLDGLAKCFVFCGGSIFSTELLETCKDEAVEYWALSKELSSSRKTSFGPDF